jgi:hypothetical protein
MSPNRRPLRVKFILSALTEATDPYWRPIKYSLFPPLGLATLAAYLASDDHAVIVDEHVEPLTLMDILIRARQLAHVTPLLEAVLSRITGANSQRCTDSPSNPPDPRTANFSAPTLSPERSCNFLCFIELSPRPDASTPTSCIGPLLLFRSLGLIFTINGELSALAE